MSTIPAMHKWRLPFGEGSFLSNRENQILQWIHAGVKKVCSCQVSLLTKGERDEARSDRGTILSVGREQRICTDQCRRAEAAAQPAIQHGPGHHFEFTLEDRLPSRWADAHYREGRRFVAGHPARSEDACHERTGRSLSRPGRDAGRFSFATLCERPQRLSHLFRAW